MAIAFRSVAHQLTGNDQHYATYRELAVTHIKAHVNFFQDFIDDDFDGGFPKYVALWVNMNADSNVEVLYLAYHRARFHYFSITKPKDPQTINQSEEIQEDNIDTEFELKKENSFDDKIKARQSESKRIGTQIISKNPSHVQAGKDISQSMEIEVPISQ